MTEQPEDEAARRRRLAEVFGDVLPDTTSDERDEGRVSARSPRATPGTATRCRRTTAEPHSVSFLSLRGRCNDTEPQGYPVDRVSVQGQTGRLFWAARRLRISSSSATSAGVPSSSAGK